MNKFLLLFVSALFLFSCSKNSAVQNPAPSITSLSVLSGNPDTQVTIDGSGFSSTLNNNTVQFNGVAAIVLSATPTVLVVKVPISCGNGPITVTTPQGTATSASFTYLPDVIVGGIELNGTNGIAKYWKNGTATAVSDGSKYEIIYSMKVSGSDIYLAGYETASNGISIAKYWKNGTAVPLTDGTHNAKAYSIFIVGTDVYVAGTEFNANGISVAKYWKNGTAVALTDGTGNAEGLCIFVNGTDVYLSGDEAILYGQSVAKFWKNGVATSLTNLPNSETSASQIAVSGNDVHVIISEWNNSTIYQYWKNGVTTLIPGATQIDNLLIVGNDVYFSGSQSKIASYWKNMIATSLSDGTNSAFAHAITVYNNDVYVTGDEFNGTVKVGKYWKNGVATNLTNGTYDAALWGITVR